MMNGQQLLEIASDLSQAYDCAKMNKNWQKVLTSITIHPEWLHTIPQGRRWNILHQIVYSGDVGHLNEVLAVQLTNLSFRLLCPTRDHKTVLDIARDYREEHPNMFQRIERLKKLDDLLNNAKECKWPMCKQLIECEPNIVNEKPPYRRFYLAHHLAYMGLLNIFLDFSGICQFKLDLLADNKTLNKIARENNHEDFADYIERINPDLLENKNERRPVLDNRNSMPQLSNPTTQTTINTTSASALAPSHSAPYPTHHYHNSQYDDSPAISYFHPSHGLPSIHNFPSSFSSTFTLDRNLEGTLVLTTNNPLPYSTYQSEYDPHIFQHSLYISPNNSQHSLPSLYNPTSSTASAISNSSTSLSLVNDKKKPESTVKKDISKMTDDEQLLYEKNIQQNLQQMSNAALINCITCPISKEILRDPVVAADGFTYERTEILRWFRFSNRSPMTNEELDSLEVKPNFAIKQILSILLESSKKQNKNDEDNKDNIMNKSI